MTMFKRLRLAISLVPVLSALALAMPAQAAPPSGGSPHVQSGTHHDFHGDFHHHHDRHDFGFGFGFWDPWWGWGAADYWGYPYYYPYYYYPPYPAYYAPPPDTPPAGQAPAPAQATGAPPPQYWYYCDNPQGYYPYVANCSSAWRQVAPTPPAGSSNTITQKQRQ